jgi:hypothetical protein
MNSNSIVDQTLSPPYVRTSKDDLFQKEAEEFVEKHKVRQVDSLPQGICMQDPEHILDEMENNLDLRMMLMSLDPKDGSSNLLSKKSKKNERGTYGQYECRITSLDDIENAIQGAWMAERQ